MWSCGLRFKVVGGRFKGLHYSLDAPNLNIGRAHEQGIRAAGWLLLDDDTVSRVQAYLRWNDMSKTYALLNRSETNPTEANDQVLVDEVELKVGDHIRMGRCVLELQEVDARFGRTTPRALPKQAVAPKEAAKAAIPAFCLDVVKGPSVNEVHAIQGHTLILGGPLGPDPGKAEFGQEIVLLDVAIRPRVLALSWNPGIGGFDLWRPHGGDTPVRVERQFGGLVWRALLPAANSGEIVAGDLIEVGQTAIRLRLVGAQARQAETPTIETPRFKSPQGGAIGVRRPRKGDR